MNKIKYIFYFLVSAFVISSCSSTEDLITPEEQAKMDDEAINVFMKSSKIVPYFVGEMVNNIEWKVEPLTADDSLNNAETLFDLMGDSYIDTLVDDINYKIYYYHFENTGSGTVVDSLNSSIQVDYEAYYLSGTIPVDGTAVYSVNFNLVDLYQSWQSVIPMFKFGTKASDFDQACDCDPYRTKIDNPGKILLISPSAMNGYGSSNMLFNIVLYHHDVPNE